MALTYETMTVRAAGAAHEAARVTGYEGALLDLTVPEQLGGLPVREIGGHAFEHRTGLRSVFLPESVKTLRSFAFYGCTALRTIELFNAADDYYDGVIRQCPSLRFVTVRCAAPDNYIIVREMLRDVDSTLSFRLFTQEGEIRLTFPEYVNEAKEDTMARAIHFSIEGAGMAYRECVGRKKLDLAAYDQLLGRLTDYDFDAASRIALGRLACPVRLQERYEKGYEVFLRENDIRALTGLIGGSCPPHPPAQGQAQTAAAGSVREPGAVRSGVVQTAAAGAGLAGDDAERMENLRILTSRRLIGRKALEAGLELASSRGQTQICSILMEYRSRVVPAQGAVTFTLDW